jgi:serine/threonine protein kinase
MYTTACPDCGRKFYLAVPEDARQSPVAAPIPPERDKAARPSQGQASVAAATADRADQLESKAESPRLTLPGHDRSASTLPGPDQRAPSAEASAVAATPSLWASLRPHSVSRLLGGYLVLRELGRVALGPCYLARQLWVDRHVTLKVMKPLWARNAPFVARFTREAYAAAQLTHPNLAKIDDLGEHKGTNYVCTEWVDGQNLNDATLQKKRLEPGEAAAYVLQAARGLRYAHDQSLIHRDIKPENLLLDQQGMVKVADLGLVNTPELAEAVEAIFAGKALPTAPTDGLATSGPSLATMTDSAVGTPSYMAPEQAIDPARVDARADIYSLGCTLYFLITGRPPFAGHSAAEIVSKHQTEPITPPEQVVKGVPGPLSTIIRKMLAKKPDERHKNLVEVIDELERFLGVVGIGTITARNEDASLLEQCVNTFNGSSSARLRSRLLPAILAACVALAFLCLITGRPVGAGLFATLAVATALADFVLVGLKYKSPLFVKVGELISTGRLSEWLTFLTALAILVVLLMFLKLFWLWLGLSFLAIGIAVAFHAAFDRQAEVERRAPREQVEGMLRSIRRQGCDEDAVRQFVCVYGGTQWEEFFEALFGYEAKLAARERWGRGAAGVSRPRFAGWRDPIAAWLDARITARRDVMYTDMLQKIEERSLHSQGENLMSARRKARRAALAMVATAVDIRESLRARDGTIMVNRSVAWSMREAATKPEKVLLEHERGLIVEPDRERTSLVVRTFSALLGSKVRFLAGAVLLAGCTAWMHQNAMISAEHATALVEAAKAGDVEAIQSHAEAGVAHARQAAAQQTQPLDLPGVSPAWLALVSSFGAGVGGLILIVSAFFGGARIAFFAIPAAAIPVLLPRLWHPALGGLDPSLAPSLVGAVILAAGVVFARR